MKETPIIPPYLTPGDRVAVVSPSGVVDPLAVKSAVKVIESWGLQVTVGASCLAVEGPFAGTDAQRILDLQQALDDKSVKAILCSRGGYGMSRIIDRVDFSAFVASPKWIVGYSDITVLNMWVGTLFGVASIHGEMLLNYNNPDNTERSITTVRDLLFGKPAIYSWNGVAVHRKTATGILTGGNLAMLYSLAGTLAMPETDGKILFIEDIGEYYYAVDRMLQSFRLGGILNNLSALLVGDFGDMQDQRIPFGKSIKEIVTDVAGGFGYPIYFGFPSGHSNDNPAIFLGREAIITADGTNLRLEYQG
ncbi:MAG: LD-carboxypeptidase [Bacteroidales bacterium]